MNTVLIWLLVSVGSGYMSHGSPTQVVERFESAADCEHMANLIRETRQEARPLLRCIQAKVVRP